MDCFTRFNPFISQVGRGNNGDSFAWFAKDIDLARQAEDISIQCPKLALNRPPDAELELSCNCEFHANLPTAMDGGSVDIAGATYRPVHPVHKNPLGERVWVLPRPVLH